MELEEESKLKTENSDKILNCLIVCNELNKSTRSRGMHLLDNFFIMKIIKL